MSFAWLYGSGGERLVDPDGHPLVWTLDPISEMAPELPAFMASFTLAKVHTASIAADLPAMEGSGGFGRPGDSILPLTLPAMEASFALAKVISGTINAEFPAMEGAASTIRSIPIVIAASLPPQEGGSSATKVVSLRFFPEMPTMQAAVDPGTTIRKATLSPRLPRFQGDVSGVRAVGASLALQLPVMAATASVHRIVAAILGASLTPLEASMAGQYLHLKHGAIAGIVPAMEAAVEAEWHQEVIVDCDIAAILPVFQGRLGTGLFPLIQATLDATMPAMEGDASALPIRKATITPSLPSLEVSFAASKVINVMMAPDLPGMEAVVATGKTVLASIAADLPAMVPSLISSPFPLHLATIEGILPHQSIAMSATRLAAVVIVGELPLIGASFSSLRTIDATIATSLPAIMVEVRGGPSSLIGKQVFRVIGIRQRPGFPYKEAILEPIRRPFDQ